MKNDTKSTKFVNYYYFLKEMIDDMASTLRNVEKVVEDKIYDEIKKLVK